jgi:hypothetical protein
MSYQLMEVCFFLVVLFGTDLVELPHAKQLNRECVSDVKVFSKDYDVSEFSCYFFSVVVILLALSVTCGERSDTVNSQRVFIYQCRLITLLTCIGVALLVYFETIDACIYTLCTVYIATCLPMFYMTLFFV